MSTLRGAILAELSRGPGRSHQVYKRVSETLGPLAAVNDGYVFQVLTKAEEDGLAVARADRDGRAVYSITPAGLDAVERWLDDPSAERGLDTQRTAARLVYAAYVKGAPTEGVVFALGDLLHRCLRHTRELTEERERVAQSQPSRATTAHLLVLDGAIEESRAKAAWLMRAQNEAGALLAEAG